MTPELKQKWLAALRSGEYNQGQEFLHRDNSFCCLGVLCDILGYKWKEEETDCGQTYSCDAGHFYIEKESEREKLGLPSEIQKVCYSMNDGLFGDVDLQACSLTEHRKYSFLEIADWLEEHLPEDKI